MVEEVVADVAEENRKTSAFPVRRCKAKYDSKACRLSAAAAGEFIGKRAACCKLLTIAPCSESTTAAAAARSLDGQAVVAAAVNVCCNDGAHAKLSVSLKIILRPSRRLPPTLLPPPLDTSAKLSIDVVEFFVFPPTTTVAVVDVVDVVDELPLKSVAVKWSTD